MRKNKTMRFASMLLVLTLLSTSVISGTFAKYVTSDSATDTARVAKWGVTVVADGTTFAKEYDKSATTKTVISTDKVVAPGTGGSLAGVTLDGTPEVAVKVYYAGEFAVSGWTINTTEFYCPLEITVNSDVIKGTDYTKAEDFVKAVNDKIGEYSNEYAAGTDLGEKNTDNLSVSWAWPFSSSADNDIKDTALAATGSTVTLKVTTTVEQVD